MPGKNAAVRVEARLRSALRLPSSDGHCSDSWIAGERARLVDPGHGDREVLVVRERLVDEPVERRIAEERPPALGRCRDRLLRRRHRRTGRRAPRLRQLARRALVLGRERASGEHGDEQANDRVTHGRLPSARSDDAAACARRAGSPRARDAPPPRSPRSSGARGSRRSMISRKKSGTKKIARNVAASMPPMTPVPTEWRAPAPAPLENASGSTPRMNASEVIRIGRNRSRAASSAAAGVDSPSWCFIDAYSTIRIAFFAARPSSVTSPIWKYTSFVCPRSQTAASAPNMPNGSASITDSGSDHFSYCAARIRNTMSAASASAIIDVPPERFSWNDAPLQSKRKSGGSTSLRDLLHARDRLAGAVAGRRGAEDLHRRQVVEAVERVGARRVLDVRERGERDHRRPSASAPRSSPMSSGVLR